MSALLTRQLALAAAELGQCMCTYMLSFERRKKKRQEVLGVSGDVIV
jgi:hypothetical protein